MVHLIWALENFKFHRWFALSFSLPFLCVCVRLCVRMPCVPIRVQAYMCHSIHEEVRGQLPGSVFTFHLVRNKSLSVVRCCMHQASWSTCYWRFSCLCLPFPTRGSQRLVLLRLGFAWDLGIRTQVTRLGQQALCPLSCYLRPPPHPCTVALLNGVGDLCPVLCHSRV